MKRFEVDLKIIVDGENEAEAIDNFRKLAQLIDASCFNVLEEYPPEDEKESSSDNSF
jgi:hypothetical protein